jgi:hypothetical protein
VQIIIGWDEASNPTHSSKAHRRLAAGRLAFSASTLALASPASEQQQGAKGLGEVHIGERYLGKTPTPVARSSGGAGHGEDDHAPIAVTMLQVVHMPS